MSVRFVVPDVKGNCVLASVLSVRFVVPDVKGNCVLAISYGPEGMVLTS